MTRDHSPIVLDQFNGLWQRGDDEEVPLDHFTDCENLQSFGTRGFKTRDGVGIHQSVAVPLGNVLRVYNYITQDKNTLLVLVRNITTGNYEIYHVIDSTTVFGPILTKAGMTDFAFVPYAGRAYISPFTSFTTGGITIEKGLQNEFVYVYKGDGTAARKAALTKPSGTLTAVNGAAGNTDAGIHLFAVVYESDTGALSAPSAFVQFTTSAALSVSFTTVPVSPDSFVVARRIVATKVLASFNGNFDQYTYYELPGGRIANNVSTTISNISFFDADLLEESSHLFDNLSEIPAGAALAIYRSRLCVAATYTDISLMYVSTAGEPEAIHSINGLVVVPLDGNPITNLQGELRDILYVFKRNRTISVTDNGDIPANWPVTIIDYAVGCPVHGVATVIDAGSSNVDFLIIASFKGIVLFNGVYSNPELSYKIRDYWLGLDRNNFKNLQMVNDSIKQFLYICTPAKKMIVGDYSNGLDPKRIKWWPWKFDFEVTTIALLNINTLVIGAEKRLF